MERRKFVIGMGALATGSAAAVGTGAFAAAGADRDVNVEVVGDSNAFLGLESTSAYAEEGENDELSLDFSDKFDSDVDASGLNPNADTRFDDIFKISNNGEDEVRIAFTEGDADDVKWAYSSDSISDEGGWAIDGEVNEDNPELDSGESIYIHALFEVEDNEGDLPENLFISADNV